MKNIFIVLAVLFSLESTSQTRVYPYSDGKKWGLTNENLEIVIQPQFDTSFYFLDNGFAIIRKNKKFGTIDRSGKNLIPTNYEQLNFINNSIGTGKINSKYAFMNFRTGKQTSPLLFDRVDQFCYCKENLFIVTQNKKHGFVKAETGQAIGKINYDQAEFMNEFPLRGKVRIGNKYGLIDLRNANLLLPVKYDVIEPEYKDDKIVISASISGNKKFFDANGKEIIHEEKEASVFTQEGIKDEAIMSVVEEGMSSQKELYIYNLGNGNWKITTEKRGYNSTEVFETYELKGYSTLQKLNYNSYDQKRPVTIKAVKDGKAGIIDLAGKELVPFVYDDIEYNYQFYKTKKENKVGMLNMELTEIKKPVLKNIVRHDYNYDAWLIEMPNGQQGYMNSKSGKIYIPGIIE